jgi:hypothetical protein
LTVVKTDHPRPNAAIFVLLVSVTRSSVQLLHVDGERVRVYGLEMAASMLDVKPRTLARQAREGKVPTVRTFAPLQEPNLFQQWLFDANDVDECRRARTGAGEVSSGSVEWEGREAELAARELAAAEREADAGRREQLVSMQEQLQERHRVSELELEVESLRAELERERAERLACEDELARVLDILQSTVARRRAAIPTSA